MTDESNETITIDHVKTSSKRINRFPKKIYLYTIFDLNISLIYFMIIWRMVNYGFFLK